MKRRNQTVVAQAKRRDGKRCQKCLITKTLEVHHIIDVAKGGPDTLDNVITLCNRCHREWHFKYEDIMVFDEYVGMPPATFVAKCMNDERFGSVTLDDIRNLWILSYLKYASPDAYNHLLR